MTVSFKTLTAKGILDYTQAQPYFEEFFTKQSSKKEKQTDMGCWFRMYVTHSEQQPVEWKFYDSSGFISDEPNNYYKQFFKTMSAVKKDCGATGFKLVCIGADVLNMESHPYFLAEYCAEQWAPVKKTFINGPKKAPFPKKQSGHF